MTWFGAQTSYGRCTPSRTVRGTSEKWAASIPLAGDSLFSMICDRSLSTRPMPLTCRESNSSQKVHDFPAPDRNGPLQECVFDQTCMEIVNFLRASMDQSEHLDGDPWIHREIPPGSIVKSHLGAAQLGHSGGPSAPLGRVRRTRVTQAARVLPVRARRTLGSLGRPECSPRSGAAHLGHSGGPSAPLH